MTLPASGAISFSNINVELCRSSTAQLSLNDSCLRTLFGQASGAVCMNTGHGKTNTSVPGAPTGVSASATSSSAISVSFSAPGCTGHLAIDYYQVVCTSSGSNSATGASSPISITGLSAATSYTFKVRAHNSKGYGCYSSSTGTATTQAVTGQAVYTTYGCYTFTPPAGVSKISSLLISPSRYTYNAGIYVPCYSWFCVGSYADAAHAGDTIYANNKSVDTFYCGNTLLTPTNTSFSIKVRGSNCDNTAIRKSFSNGQTRNLIYSYGNNGSGGQHWIGSYAQYKNTGETFIAQGGYKRNSCKYPINGKSLGGGGATGAGHGRSAQYYSDGLNTYYSLCNTQGPSLGGGPGAAGNSGACDQGYSGGAGGGGGGSGSGGGGGGGAGLYGGNNTGSGGSAGSGGGGGSGGCNGGSASGINGGRGGSYGGGAGGGYNYYACGSNYRFGVGGNPPDNSNPHYGAIRIVWPGCVRKFPNTCVGNY